MFYFYLRLFKFIFLTQILLAYFKNYLGSRECLTILIKIYWKDKDISCILRIVSLLIIIERCMHSSFKLLKINSNFYFKSTQI